MSSTWCNQMETFASTEVSKPPSQAAQGFLKQVLLTEVNQRSLRTVNRMGDNSPEKQDTVYTQ